MVKKVFHSGDLKIVDDKIKHTVRKCKNKLCERFFKNKTINNNICNQN